MTTPAPLYFVRSDKVKEKPVGADVALYVGERRSIHVPNATARFIWECLKQPVTFDELLFMLTEAFDVERGTLERDLRETLDFFATSDLIRTTTSDDGPALP